jgi:hypothetical protein
MSKLNEVLLKQGRITQDVFDKEASKELAKDKYKKEKATLKKADLEAILNILTS